MEKNKKAAKEDPKTVNKPYKPNYDKKAQINNEIIQCQEKFKQAKICTIRKLVEKLKHPEKNPKQNRTAKTERYQNVLNQLKQMSPKRLGLLALINHKSGKNYLADQNSTVEQLAVGYFSEYKTINGILDAIRNKLNLHERSDWKKLSKKLFRKKEQTTEAEKVTETENSEENSNARGKKKNSKRTAEKKGNAATSNESTAKKDKMQKKSKQTNVQENGASAESDDSSESEEDADLEKNDTPAEALTAIDEFFITADGSNYLSTAVSNSKQEEELDDDHHPNQGKSYAKKPHEASFFHKSDKKPAQLAVNRFENKKRRWPDNAEEEVHTVKETKLDPDLHPSWQAKQKQKPIITEFKGKKITFD